MQAEKALRGGQAQLRIAGSGPGGKVGKGDQTPHIPSHSFGHRSS